MSDLISRADATSIPVLPKEHREYQTFNLDDAYEQGWNDLQKCIETLPSAEPQWIPVSERLPEDSGCVLISIAGDIEFGAYDRKNSDWAIWRDGYWDEGKRADAWMPLPEPYREDGEE